MVAEHLHRDGRRARTPVMAVAQFLAITLVATWMSAMVSVTSCTLLVPTKVLVRLGVTSTPSWVGILRPILASVAAITAAPRFWGLGQNGVMWIVWTPAATLSKATVALGL